METPPVHSLQRKGALHRGFRRAWWRYRTATSGLRTLPDYLIIGAQRAGSTSLYSYLVQHPLVGAASHKEIHFFDLNYFRGVPWYRRHFPTELVRRYTRRRLGSPLLSGESSPYYLFHPHVPARVFGLLPRVKLIVLLREPVARAYSHYQLERRAGRETLSFEEAVQSEPERIQTEAEKLRDDPTYDSGAHRHFSYVARGLYADQLENWFAFFSPEQFLIVRSEDLFADAASVVRTTVEFLGLPQRELEDYRTPLVYSPYPEIPSDTKERLGEYFEEHNRRLYGLIDRDLGWEA